MNKCQWVKAGIYEEYHDNEHGKMIFDNVLLFERLVLEIMQPGLSFEIILKKRENFKKAFANYDLELLGMFTDKDVETLMDDQSIVRHELKIRAVIHNASLVYKIIQEQELYLYIIDLLDYRLDRDTMVKQACKELKKRGFKFIGPSVFESLIASIGLLEGHTLECILNKTDQIEKMAVATTFGMLEVHYSNYQIIYSKYNGTIHEECIPDDAFAQVILRQIDLYNHQQLDQFKLSYQYEATAFQRLVYSALLETKFGDYLTYKDIANRINSRGYQAVGSALNKNKIQFFIPCHRVGNKRKIGGFAADEDRKFAMLKFEGANIPE